MAGKHSPARGPGKVASDGGSRRKRAKKPLLISLSILLMLAVVGGAAVYFYFFDGHVLAGWLRLALPAQVSAPKPVAVCPLDGSIVSDASMLKRRPILIKVENHPDARPQSGLDKADVVIEAMAEGGITRFAAVFWCRDVEEIGPVRSGRLQDLTFAAEYDAIFAHVGGSDAWMEAKTSTLADLDQFAFGDTYWRSADRDAPHNVYTTTERLHKTAAAEGLEKTVSIDAWKFKSAQPGAGKITSVKIPYGAQCACSYSYDKATNKYLRYVEDEPFLDKPTGAQIAPKNVVIMYVDYDSSDFGEEYGLGGRDVMQLIGEGKAVVLRDGQAVTGRWTKADASSRTMFIDDNGQPITFNRGQTWIEIIPSSWDITLG